MATEEEKTIKVLNDLIHTAEDGRKGFMTAAEKARDTQLKTLFKDRSQVCAAAVTELQDMVRALGGNPEHAGSLVGTAHRGWVRLRAKVGNDLAILNEVEHGEDVARAAYTRALQANLIHSARPLVERQYENLLHTHVRVRELQARFQGRVPE